VFSGTHLHRLPLYSVPYPSPSKTILKGLIIAGMQRSCLPRCDEGMSCRPMGGQVDHLRSWASESDGRPPSNSTRFLNGRICITTPQRTPPMCPRMSPASCLGHPSGARGLRRTVGVVNAWRDRSDVDTMLRSGRLRSRSLQCQPWTLSADLV
jgi:hypothetical protein